MGHIVDVIVDRAGAVRAAVIDFGGFLGVGSRKIVVDWSALHFGQIANKKRQHHARTDQGAGQRRRPNTRRTSRSWCWAHPAACGRSSSIAEINGEALWPRVRPIRLIGSTTIAPAAGRRRRCCAVGSRSSAGGRAQGPQPSRQSLRGLDWFIFFLADVQTGFGPFIAVYLTTQKWTQVEIGLVLSIGGVVGLIGQMPGGAIVDAARSERLVAGLAIAAIGCSRARLCGLADLSGGGDRGDPARGRELRARSGDRRDQPRSGRTARDRRTARAQRPLCVARQRRCRGRDGHLRLSSLQPLGVSRHLHSGDSDAAGAFAHPRERSRCRPRAWRGGARRRPMPRRPAS